jgi:hypothetical protein
MEFNEGEKKSGRDSEQQRVENRNPTIVRGQVLRKHLRDYLNQKVQVYSEAINRHTLNRLS